MVTQQVEIERKYDVLGGQPPALALERLEKFTAGEPAVHEMSATYYDTADLALARAKVAVRRRRGGQDAGWHVKYQAGDARGEVHHEPLKSAPERMPAALRKLLLGLTLGEELTPVATIRTHRTQYPILRAQEQQAELCLDAVTARDERAGIDREWFECEVELSRADLTQKQSRKVFEAVEAVLYAGGAAPSTSAAKIARALGQDGGDESASVPEGAKAAKKHTKTTKKGNAPNGGAPAAAGARENGSAAPGRTGADVLAEMLSRLLAEVRTWDFAVRLDAEDSVHQLRVRSRALRSVLQAARGFVTDEVSRDLEQRLKDLARVLGDARDQEVARERLEVMLATHPAHLISAAAGQELRSVAQQLEDDAARAVRRELDSPEYLRLLRDVAGLAGGDGFTAEPARLSPKAFAKAVLGAALDRVVTTAATALPEDPQSVMVSPMAEVVGDRVGLPGRESWQTAAAFEILHETRKAAKSARYVSEALARAHAKPGKKRLRAATVAKDYQDDLGVVTDAAVMEEWLARAARSFQRTGRDRYAVGLLHGMELGDLRDAMLEAPEMLEDLVEDLRAALPSED